MQDSDAPTKIPLKWAATAAAPYVNPIPTGSQPGGRASFTDGFPPPNFVARASGGIPPWGADMNGALQQITAGLQWLQAGGPSKYDGAFQTLIGGYPKNAFVASAVTDGLFWLSTTDNNVTNPDTGGAGWTSVALGSISPLDLQKQAGNYAVDTGTANAGVITLSPVPASLASLVGAPIRVKKIASANTGMYTLAVNGFAVTSVVYPDGEAIPVGALPASGIFEVAYDGTNFELLSVTKPQAPLVQANLDFYVATTGSNTNDGLSVGTPFLTLQHAVDVIQETYSNLSSFNANVHVAAGSYAAGAVASKPINGTIAFISTGAATITATNSNCFVAKNGAAISLTGAFTLLATGSLAAIEGIAVIAFQSSLVTINSGVVFGACSNYHLSAQNGVIQVLGAYTVSGGAATHITAINGGLIVYAPSLTMIVTGTPAFSLYFAYAAQCGVIAAGQTFGDSWSGSATGQRYFAELNGVFSSTGSDATFFPGSIAGSTATGGQYG